MPCVAGDLAPVSLAAVTPLILVVHPSLPVRSVKDLVAFARARPGQLTYRRPAPVACNTCQASYSRSR
jgi:tripartite-type tricarboxylate transporter receptor subunit TctC